ncbi:MAG TPA: DUF4442 domain-containing protein [Ferruginibacter sp.]|jgi:hypothetical protein|nr:DUF4442 domain-containing protein [Ferruginibacter sp.]
MDIAKQNFIQFVQHPLKFRWFLLTKIPSAFFSGVRVRSLDESKSEVTVPFKWFTQNPFKSTYFACLAMAAELSTGLLAMMNVYEKNTKVSMLVIALEVKYFKKATGITTFICEDATIVNDTVAAAISSGEGKTVKCRSVGKNSEGELVAEFLITWSFKAKTTK